MKKGTIKTIENFEIPQLNRKRTLRIYLPPDYETSSNKYPVIYMHDAQNLFDVTLARYGMIWHADVTLDKLYNEGTNQGLIMVGIDNGEENRYNEYSPWKNEKIQDLLFHLKDKNLQGGEGFQYIDFIVENLKPYIDKEFRTLSDRENTAIIGSSMGGFISIAAGIKYQNIFSKVGAFSSAIWFHESAMLEFLENAEKRDGLKIYMDIGTNETSNVEISEFPKIYVDTNKNLYNKLINKGFAKDEVKFEIFQDAVHNEIEWDKRLPDVIKWLFE